MDSRFFITVTDSSTTRFILNNVRDTKIELKSSIFVRVITDDE